MQSAALSGDNRLRSRSAFWNGLSGSVESGIGCPQAGSMSIRESLFWPIMSDVAPDPIGHGIDLQARRKTYDDVTWTSVRRRRWQIARFPAGSRRGGFSLFNIIAGALDIQRADAMLELNDPLNLINDPLNPTLIQ